MENPPHPPPLPHAESTIGHPLAASVLGTSRATPQRWSTVAKVVLIGVLIAVLHVPLLLIWDTLRERESLRAAAVEEMSRTWGADQVIVGPFLCVPYTVATRVPRQTVVGDRVLQSEELREVKGTAYFLPGRYEVNGTMDVSVRNRGIFRTPVYASALSLSGEFHPDFAALGLDRPTLDWARARIRIGISDAHGFRSSPVWKQEGGVTAVFSPAPPDEQGWTGIDALPGYVDAEAARVPFSVELSFQGSRRLAVVPVGEANSVALKGAWPDPSFDGGYLPVERTVGAEGFSARWTTTHFGRQFPSAWSEQPGRENLRADVLRSTALGVTLAMPVDTYRMVERSLKYAILVLLLVFAVYFLFEVTSPVRVHPLQYIMVGGALVLFYLGFLALAEFVAVVVAYVGAAGASTLLIAGYSWSVLKTGARSLLVGGGLGATYAYLYFMLQLQDFALLAGAAALFALLALGMWFTRRLDWNQLDGRTPARV